MIAAPTKLALVSCLCVICFTAWNHSRNAKARSSCTALSCVVPMKSSLSKDALAGIHGKIQVVDSFPDYKVQIVDSFPDIKVQVVDSFPDGAGKWQYVNSFPDHKIQFVDSFPDFSVQFVSSFPGVN